MNVEELINRLSKYNPKREVIIEIEGFIWDKTGDITNVTECLGYSGDLFAPSGPVCIQGK